MVDPPYSGHNTQISRNLETFIIKQITLLNSPSESKKEKVKVQKKVFKQYEKLGAEEEQYAGKMKACENRDYSARQVSNG